MRLIGVLEGAQPWIAVEVPGGSSLVATVEDFYADPSRHLRVAGERREADGATRQAAVFIPRGAKVLCAGLNYVSHVAEAKREPPKHPDIFARWPSTLVPGGTSVPVPTGEPGLDWEGELAAVIGRPVKDATPEEVEDAIFGYTILNDLSARLHQRKTAQWCIGKNADRSGPIGPAIVTRDEIRDPYALRIETRVEGQVMQDGCAGDMLFRIGQIGAYASETMTLRPGDVISTGTPSGVGAARTPPVFLGAGQVVEVEIKPIGVLSTPIG